MGTLVTLLVIGVIALVIGGLVVGIFNKLVTLKNRYQNAFAQIEVQLKRDPEHGRGRQGLHGPRKDDAGGGDPGA